MTSPTDEYHGLDGFGDLAWDKPPNLSMVKMEPAAYFLGKLITKNPGKIAVIGTAPSTNIAMAAKMYPSFMTDVKSLHVMGGNYVGMSLAGVYLVF